MKRRLKGAIGEAELVAGKFGLIRATHLALLVILSVTLAHLLSLHQYGLYARGSFFASAYATIMLVGQDQLVLQGRLPIRSLRHRGIAILVGTSAVILPLAAATVSTREFVVIAVSCAGTAGMVLVYGELTALLVAGAHVSRGALLLLNAVSIQAGSVIAAAVGARALVATAAGTAVSITWVVFILTWKLARPNASEVAPFRAGVWMGASAILYGAIPTIAGIATAVRAADTTAGEVRFVLLAFGAVVAICSAINSEYFRAHLFAASRTGYYDKAVRDMVKVNTAIAVILLLGLPLTGILVSIGLPARFGGAAGGIALIAVVVPFLLSSQVQTNLEIVKGRSWLPLARNAPAVIAVTVLVLILPATTTGVVVALIASEALGLSCFVVARRFSALRDGGRPGRVRSEGGTLLGRRPGPLRRFRSTASPTSGHAPSSYRGTTREKEGTEFQKMSQLSDRPSPSGRDLAALWSSRRRRTGD